MKFNSGNDLRPVSAINKLSKVKRNVFPSLTNNQSYSNNNITANNTSNQAPSNVLDATHSPVHPRIRSAYPSHYDKEKLYDENLNLKAQLNKTRNEVSMLKKENNNLEAELNKKDKMLEELALDTQNSMINNIEKVNDLYNQNKLLNRATETHLVINLKKQFKEIKKELSKKKEELEELKKTLKNTKIHELQSENKILNEEISKLKTFYDFSLQQNSMNEKNIKDFLALKEDYNKQDFVIISLQGEFKKLQEELNFKEEELTKLTKNVTDKQANILKLRKDLKYQYQINERLINTTDYITKSEEYLTMKNKLDRKVNELRKELVYYKDVAERREKRIREFEKARETVSHKESPHFVNCDKIEENPEEKTDSTLLLLKSKLQESDKEREKLRNIITEMESKIRSFEEGKVEIDNIYSMNNLPADKKENSSVSTRIKLEEDDPDLLSDNELHEVIYILLKNLEANKYDRNSIESMVLRDGVLLDMLNKDEKKFSLDLTDNLLNMLKVKNQGDKKTLHSLVKTFVYLNVSNQEIPNKKGFGDALLSLFGSIKYYSSEDKQSYNKHIYKKFLPYEKELKEMLEAYDQEGTGHITFLNLRNILGELNIKLTNKLIEYLIYLMKSFIDEDRSIYDLRYINLTNLLEKGKVEYQDQELSDEEDLDESDNFEEADEESAIEISNEDYLRKVEKVMRKISVMLTKSSSNLDDYFRDHVITKSDGKNVLNLAGFVHVLGEKFNIIIDSIDIYCVYTKLKFNDTDDEIIDYNKLSEEVQSIGQENPTIECGSLREVKLMEALKSYLSTTNKEITDLLEEMNVNENLADIKIFKDFLVLKGTIENNHSLIADTSIAFNGKVDISRLKKILNKTESKESDFQQSLQSSSGKIEALKDEEDYKEEFDAIVTKREESKEEVDDHQTDSIREIERDILGDDQDD